MKSSIRWPWFVAIPSLLVLLAALAVKLAGYAPVYPYPSFLLALLSGAALLVSVGFLATSNLQSRSRRALRITSVAAAIVTLTIGGLFAMTFLSFENTRCHGIYTSPNKSHQLAVMHFGFLEDFVGPVEGDSILVSFN